MKTNKIRHAFESYLNAFNTIKKYNSNQKTTTFVAILQALSYILIIPPLIALIGKKITESKGTLTENKSNAAAMNTLPVAPIKKILSPEQQAILDQIEKLKVEYLAEKQKIQNLRKEILQANETWKKSSAEADAFQLTRNEIARSLRKANKQKAPQEVMDALIAKQNQFNAQASTILENKVKAAQDLDMNPERETKLKRSLNDTVTLNKNLIKLWEKLKEQGGEGADEAIAELNKENS